MTDTATASHLTLERMFDAPALNGPVPGMIRYAPDARHIAWLRPADDDAQRLDLWLHDVADGSARCLVDARSLDDSRALSEEEKARRERLRIFAGGIVEFAWTADSRALLFPLAGRLYRLEIGVDGDERGAETSAPRPLTPAEMFVTDVRPAPQGDAVAFVHERDLWIIDSAAAASPPRQLTFEAGDTTSCGLAEFIAQEEMHRLDGFWWSPDARSIATLKVDEASIPLSYRYEITAEGFDVIGQRYPYAGEANATVELGVVDVASATLRWLPWRDTDSEYLARVNWHPDNQRLFIQRQPRLQQRLDLVELDVDGAQRVVLQEHSDTWINLHDDLHFIDAERALWCSERDDAARLFLLDLASGELTPLTPAHGMVTGLLDADDDHAWILGWFDTPIERHLYRVSLQADSAPQRLTTDAGVHQVLLAPDRDSFVDRHDSAAHPPQTLLCGADGSLRQVLAANDPTKAQHPYHPFLPRHVAPQAGTLTAEDGSTLHYRLTLPHGVEDGARHPVIVSVYGGPGVQRVTAGWGPLMHQYFAQRGWGVLELDNRGSSGRGRRFESAIHLRMGAAEVADQLRGLTWLREQDWVDAKRIAVFGHSYGGYMALMCLARHPQDFCAAVSVAPVTDWTLYDTHYTERFLDTPQHNAEGYAASSVFDSIEGLVQADPGSLLLMHGMADDNVLFTHTTRLMKALQDRGVQFDLMTYPAAKHGLAGRETSLHRFRVIESFLRRRFNEDNR